jgi:hypothetical protein
LISGHNQGKRLSHSGEASVCAAVKTIFAL